MTTDKLKPCPFCGGAIIRICRIGLSNEANGYCGATEARCENCSASVSAFDTPDKNGWCLGVQDTRERATAAWNTRAESAEVIALREREARLREALTRITWVLDDEHGAMEAAALSYARTALKGDDNG